MNIPDEHDRETVPGADALLQEPVFERREPPTLRERMRLHSRQPERDDEFSESLDFPGVVVKAGRYGERTFAFSRECRVVGLRLPKGFLVERVVLKIGHRFRPIPESGEARLFSTYEGEDCLVFEGEEAVRAGEWKKHRLVPELQAGLYVLVKNATEDDLRFEGTIRLAQDKVPEPEHEEV